MWEDSVSDAETETLKVTVDVFVIQNGKILYRETPRLLKRTEVVDLWGYHLVEPVFVVRVVGWRHIDAPAAHPTEF